MVLGLYKKLKESFFPEEYSDSDSEDDSDSDSEDDSDEEEVVPPILSEVKGKKGVAYESMKLRKEKYATPGMLEMEDSIFAETKSYQKQSDNDRGIDKSQRGMRDMENVRLVVDNYERYEGYESDEDGYVDVDAPKWKVLGYYIDKSALTGAIPALLLWTYFYYVTISDTREMRWLYLIGVIFLLSQVVAKEEEKVGTLLEEKDLLKGVLEMVVILTSVIVLMIIYFVKKGESRGAKSLVYSVGLLLTILSLYNYSNDTLYVRNIRELSVASYNLSIMILLVVIIENFF